MAEDAVLEPVSGVRVVWDLAQIGPHVRGEADDGWRLEGSADGRLPSIRVLTAIGDQGSTLLIAGARPDSDEGHDAERLAALLGDTEGSVQPVEETLVSTEYATDGSVRRVGLELYLPGEDYALRAAGDASAQGEFERSGVTLTRATLDFRLDGQHGAARLDLLRPR